MPVGSLVQWTTLFSPIQRMVNQCPAGSRVPDRDDEWDPVMFLEAQPTTILLTMTPLTMGMRIAECVFVPVAVVAGSFCFWSGIVWMLATCNPLYMVKIGKRVRVYGVSWRHYT
ncbi:hypothetical protein VFPPC_17747 [Pochonia chlamydosporia 170]|uniref:Uncharacterized protein n=1 Tax=Pochonia chlamydosporia 170 TaxID=1380566 RepID=A0A219AQL4_METCM|nr:hypothetical protein VFPPC_17747 [Pochonia chlamydosporia 170]OWT43077.1 hypothetical protein VFPPC_17747 [Pochonia chlamydosporia 170]